MRFKPLLFVTFFSILLFVSTVVGKDFEVSVDVIPQEMDRSPCSIAAFDVNIQNIGETDDSYSLSVDGIPEDWYSLSHDSVSLNAGDSQTIYLFITPYCYGEVGSYEGMVSVIGNANASNNFTLDVIPDHEIKVTLPEEVSSCLCEEDEVVAVIENLKNYTEDLTISVSGNATEFIVIENTKLSIGPNEMKEIVLKKSSVCDSGEGVYSLVLEADSTTSYAKSSDSSVIEMIKCYDFEVAYEEEVVLCSNVSTLFTIGVENTGTKDDTYSINIQDLEKSVSLVPGETKTFEFSFVEEEVETYEVPFVVESAFKEIEGKINFIVEKCYGVDLEVAETEIEVEEGRGRLVKATITNIGTRTDDFEVVSDVAWVSIKPSMLNVVAGESEEVYIYYSPEFGAMGSYDTIITVKSLNSQDEENVVIEVVEGTVGTTTSVLPVTTTSAEETTTTPETTTAPEEPKTITSRFIELITKNEYAKAWLIACIITLIIIILMYLFVMRD